MIYKPNNLMPNSQLQPVAYSKDENEKYVHDFSFSSDLYSKYAEKAEMEIEPLDQTLNIVNISDSGKIKLNDEAKEIYSYDLRGDELQLQIYDDNGRPVEGKFYNNEKISEDGVSEFIPSTMYSTSTNDLVIDDIILFRAGEYSWKDTQHKLSVKPNQIFMHPCTFQYSRSGNWDGHYWYDTDYLSCGTYNISVYNKKEQLRLSLIPPYSMATSGNDNALYQHLIIPFLFKSGIEIFSGEAIIGNNSLKISRFTIPELRNILNNISIKLNHSCKLKSYWVEAPNSDSDNYKSKSNGPYEFKTKETFNIAFSDLSDSSWSEEGDNLIICRGRINKKVLDDERFNLSNLRSDFMVELYFSSKGEGEKKNIVLTKINLLGGNVPSVGLLFTYYQPEFLGPYANTQAINYADVGQKGEKWNQTLELNIEISAAGLHETAFSLPINLSSFINNNNQEYIYSAENVDFKQANVVENSIDFLTATEMLQNNQDWKYRFKLYNNNNVNESIYSDWMTFKSLFKEPSLSISYSHDLNKGEFTGIFNSTIESVLSHQWKLYNDNKVIYDTGIIYSNDLKFSYNNFLPEMLYDIELIVEDNFHQYWSKKVDNIKNTDYSIQNWSPKRVSKPNLENTGVYVAWEEPVISDWKYGGYNIKRQDLLTHEVTDMGEYYFINNDKDERKFIDYGLPSNTESRYLLFPLGISSQPKVKKVSKSSKINLNEFTRLEHNGIDILLSDHDFIKLYKNYIDTGDIISYIPLNNITKINTDTGETTDLESITGITAKKTLIDWIFDFQRIENDYQFVKLIEPKQEIKISSDAQIALNDLPSERAANLTYSYESPYMEDISDEELFNEDFYDVIVTMIPIPGSGATDSPFLFRVADTSTAIAILKSIRSAVAKDPSVEYVPESAQSDYGYLTKEDSITIIKKNTILVGRGYNINPKTFISLTLNEIVWENYSDAQLRLSILNEYNFLNAELYWENTHNNIEQIKWVFTSLKINAKDKLIIKSIDTTNYTRAKEYLNSLTAKLTYGGNEITEEFYIYPGTLLIGIVENEKNFIKLILNETEYTEYSDAQSAISTLEEKTIGTLTYKKPLKTKIIDGLENMEQYTDESFKELEFFGRIVTSLSSAKVYVLQLQANLYYGENISILRQPPEVTVPIKPEWDKWCLFTTRGPAPKNLDGTDTSGYNENALLVDKIFFFEMNVESGAMKNNTDFSVVKNFTRYPTVQRSHSNYWSGQLKGLLGRLAIDDCTFKQTPTMLEEIKELTQNTSRKFLKDRDGNFWEVELSSDITIDTNDKLDVQLKTKSFNWVEVGDASNVALVAIGKNNSEWMLTDLGYQHIDPTAYIWDDEAIWDDDKFITEDEEDGNEQIL